MERKLKLKELSNYLYWLSIIAVTKYHKRSGLNNRNLLSHNLGDYMFKTKVWAGLGRIYPVLSQILVVFRQSLTFLGL